jgi:hypothetical protein
VYTVLADAPVDDLPMATAGCCGTGDTASESVCCAPTTTASHDATERTPQPIP